MLDLVLDDDRIAPEESTVVDLSKAGQYQIVRRGV